MTRNVDDAEGLAALRRAVALLGARDERGPPDAGVSRVHGRGSSTAICLRWRCIESWSHVRAAARWRSSATCSITSPRATPPPPPDREPQPHPARRSTARTARRPGRGRARRVPARTRIRLRPRRPAAGGPVQVRSLRLSWTAEAVCSATGVTPRSWRRGRLTPHFITGLSSEDCARDDGDRRRRLPAARILPL